MAVGAAVAERISRLGSVRFDEFVELALYHEPGGFFSGGGGAGRAGADFLTSPEVGPLFGAVVARFLDTEWVRLGRPDPFVVVEAAAGRGALAIAVLAAGPECAAALRYVLVERSEALRARQPEHLPLVQPFEILGPTVDPEDPVPSPTVGTGPLVCSLTELPSQPVDGVVLANELLDNVPFRLFERGPSSWLEVRVTSDGGSLVELLVEAEHDLAERLTSLVPAAAPGARVPWQQGAADWLVSALAVLRTGSVVVVDYADTTSNLAARPSQEWLRTYVGHGRGGSPLDRPGHQDVTCEVALDQLARQRPPSGVSSQTDWLRRYGLDGLVADGRHRWAEGAAAGDLAALAGRSRVAEAEALTDPAGLG
ncbi:MAG: SAM-dependent methyltransferase, partial [Actinomycetes bacterium]